MWRGGSVFVSVKGNGSIGNDLLMEVAMLKWRSEDDYFSANLNVTVFNYAARPYVIRSLNMVTIAVVGKAEFL